MPTYESRRLGGRREHDEAEVKANFDAIYVQEDPREYFRVLYGLDYIIPELARPLFRQLVETLTILRGRPITVLDLGSSFGINPALLRFPVELDRLAKRYRDLQHFGLTPSEVIEFDRNYYRSWPRANDARIVGLDVSRPAISYALDVGLIDAGFAENLEQAEPSQALADALAEVDLVVSTGCVGYVTAKTFSRLFAAMKRPKPWVASFVLRLYDYDDIAHLLKERGLITEKLENVTFVQRHFHTQREYAEVIASLEAKGIDPAGKESDGLFHAELFLSRSADEARGKPLDDLISVTSGEARVTGRRFQRQADNTIRLVR